MGGRRQGLDEQLESYRNGAVRRIRKATIASHKQRRKWAGFAAVGAATLASPSRTTAEIIHVVPPSPIAIDVSSQIGRYVNLDGNGGNDLLVGAGNENLGGIFQLYYGIARGAGGALVVGSAQASPNQRVALRRYSLGSLISPFAAIGGSFVRTTLVAGGATVYANGLWDVSDVGYAGVRLTSSRAGWIRIRTRSNGGRLEKVDVLEWAYESIAGKPIVAGDDGSGSAIVPKGDYSGNGSVGQEDYNLWKSHFGRSASPAGSGADGNSDGQVNAADFVVWRNNRAGGAGSGLSSQEVPEPSAISLGTLALGAAGVLALRRNNRDQH